MTLDDAIRIVTLAEEPELLLEPGEPAPVIRPDVLEKARAVCEQAEILFRHAGTRH